MENQKKGQAAMEFLMTYGWAILAAVVVIGVLAYFGVFSPGRFLPSACTLNAPFGCEEFAVSVVDGLSIVVRNGAGDPITISDITVSNCGSNISGITIADGSTQLVNFATCTPALVEGAKFRGDITVTYTRSGGQLDQTSTGTITGTVAA